MNGEKAPKENNATADAWQNMASKVSEMTKNMNKTELGKRALRAAIIGLTTAAIASFAISKGEKDSAPWAENPTATEFDAGTGGTVDNSAELTDEEAARIFKEKGGSTNSEKTDATFQGNDANPDTGLTPEFDEANDETIQAGEEAQPSDNSNEEISAEDGVTHNSVNRGITSDAVAEDPELKPMPPSDAVAEMPSDMMAENPKPEPEPMPSPDAPHP